MRELDYIHTPLPILRFADFFSAMKRNESGLPRRLRNQRLTNELRRLLLTSFAARTNRTPSSTGVDKSAETNRPTAAARPGVALCPARRTTVMTSREPVRADLRTAGDDGDESPSDDSASGGQVG